MTTTMFGCSYTELWVSPKDWKTTTSKKALQKDWYVQCNFFDPLFKDKYPRGRVFRRKANKPKTLDERRAQIEFFLEEIPQLFNDGYNHITETYMVPEVSEPEPDKLHPTTPVVKAIELAWNIIRDEALQNIPKKDRDKAKPFDDVRVAKTRFVKGLENLRYDTIPISEIRLGEIKETMAHLKITEGYYNKFLSYMSKIFTELIEYGCIEQNPFKLFKKKRPAKKAREILTEEEFMRVMAYLKEKHYGFYRYAMIFHQSGARSTELMMVRKKDVDLAKQEYRVTIKKGNQNCIETKVIMINAIPLWKEVLSECKNDYSYLFSEWLRPGGIPIAPRQISRKWNKFVKKQYNEIYDTNVTADFYALKHLFLDKIDALQSAHRLKGINLAQIHASHRSPAMTNSVYLVNKKQRERELLKTIVVK